MTHDPDTIDIRRITETDRGQVVRVTTKVLRETDAQKQDIFDEAFWTWQYTSGVASGAIVGTPGPGVRSTPTSRLGE